MFSLVQRYLCLLTILVKDGVREKIFKHFRGESLLLLVCRIFVFYTNNAPTRECCSFRK